jgi:YOP proteins translocation protein K (YscK)
VIDLDLLRHAPQSRIAALLGHGVSQAFIDRLRGTPRLNARLAALIAEQLGEVGDLTMEQRTALALGPEAMAGLAVQAGAVWHAGAIARIIDGAARRMLIGLLGEDTYRLALDGLPLAAAEVPDQSPEAIADAAPGDGAACFAAWCDTQPLAVAGRLALARPIAAVTPAHRASGPAVIDWLLGRR